MGVTRDYLIETEKQFGAAMSGIVSYIMLYFCATNDGSDGLIQTCVVTDLTDYDRIPRVLATLVVVNNGHSSS